MPQRSPSGLCRHWRSKAASCASLQSSSGRLQTQLTGGGRRHRELSARCFRAPASSSAPLCHPLSRLMTMQQCNSSTPNPARKHRTLWGPQQEHTDRERGGQASCGPHTSDRVRRLAAAEAGRQRRGARRAAAAAAAVCQRARHGGGHGRGRAGGQVMAVQLLDCQVATVCPAAAPTGAAQPQCKTSRLALLGLEEQSGRAWVCTSRGGYSRGAHQRT